MKVLHVCHEYPPECIGGIATHTAHLVDGLASLGIRCGVATVPCRQDSGRQAATWRSRRRPYRPARDWGDEELAVVLGDACRQACREMSFDLVHCHESKAFPAAAAVCAQAGLPLVATVHSTEAGRRRGQLLPQHEQQEARRIAMVRHADVAIAVSHAVRNTLIALGVDGERVCVVHNGVPDHATDFVRAQGGTSPPRFCVVGRLEHEKGADFIAPLVGQVRDHSPAARLSVVGDGRHRPTLEVELRQAIASGAVELCGALEHRRALQVMAGCDVLALTSRYDSYPMVMLEAAALGTALVAFDVGGVGEFIHHQSTGLLVPPDDTAAMAAAIGHLLEHAAARRAFAERARARYLELGSASRMARSTAAVYEQALSLATVRPAGVMKEVQWTTPCSS